MALVLGSLSACAYAQPTNPQFYMWNPEPYGWTHDSRYMPMIRIYVENKTGDVAASEVISAINSRLGSSPPTIQAGKICVLLQNYASDEEHYDGTDWNPFNSTTALTRSADELSVPSWHLEGNEDSQNPRNQVWFKPDNSIASPGANLAEWVDDFIAEFGVYDPEINRFHLDVETAIAPCCDANHMQVLLLAESDPRWDTLPVPGFGSQTMADLWEEATIEWGLSQPTLLNDLLEVGAEALDTPVTRQVYLWYFHIAQRARAAVLNETTFLPLTAKWEEIVCSNYEDSHLDNETDTFGWFYDWPASPGPSPELTNTATRSFAVYNNLGFDNTPYAPIYPTHEESGRFFWIHTSTFANHGSPVLYNWSNNHRLPNPYTHPSAPIETQWEASLRNQRRWLEAEINSRGVGGQEAVSPWIAMVGTTITFPANFTVTLDDAVRQLSLLRQKRIENVLVWGDDETIDEDWCILDHAYRMAYSAVAAQAGTDDGYDLGTNSISMIEDTLRIFDGTSIVENTYKIGGEYSNPDEAYIATLGVQFTGLNNAVGCGLALDLEMSANACDAVTTIYISDFELCIPYEQCEPQWRRVDVYNDGTYVDESITYDRVPDFTTRRRIVIPDATNLISPSSYLRLPPGSLEVRIVTMSNGQSECCETPSCPELEVAIDLVQLSRIPGAVGGNPCYPYCGPLFESFGEVAVGGLGGVVLADIDLSGRVTERDFDKFMASWLEETGRAGDYVRDGVYDEADVSAFLTDYFEAIQ
ncbi:MAG: hypothetical protein KF859_13260 [Phycisphaeraceae bacterium]|nr:hypothetical protein [Phycisphaeraceae bacterium]